MDKQTAIDNLFKEVKVPTGTRILYGLNFLPKDELYPSFNNFLLITYDEQGKQELHWNIDCFTI